MQDSLAMSVTTDSGIYFLVSASSILLSLFNLCADDHNRVELKGDPDVEGSDYINVSFIDVSWLNFMAANKILYSSYRALPTRKEPTELCIARY